ncbi:hypothetical protein SAMN00790413_06146 [Deinococcus hopiensis KR-140]|uniref:Uncharacterized protein n=1 Tax=Deinococcus hopiensis KR-140 TaxID=695939 RepID=A0A1W1VWT6_9DEIO|nr:hypothetical protein SAMN00790413_06146 [Deinococcus hopiensis KR-140]
MTVDLRLIYVCQRRTAQNFAAYLTAFLRISG